MLNNESNQNRSRWRRPGHVFSLPEELPLLQQSGVIKSIGSPNLMGRLMSALASLLEWILSANLCMRVGPGLRPLERHEFERPEALQSQIRNGMFL